MEITINCKNCHTETSVEVPVLSGYYAFCPICGEGTTLCTECLNDNSENCDYDYRTDSCKWWEEMKSWERMRSNER